MSGVVAVYRRGGEVSAREVRTMLESTRPRGGDREVTSTDGQVGFGYRDSRRGGPSPNDRLAEREGVRAIIDGRIDGRDELAASLGVADRSASLTDAELAIEAYLEWGEDFPKRLVGAFGMVLWDENRERFLAVRDKTGIRHLYYAVVGSVILFASETTPITERDDVSTRPNEGLLVEYVIGNVNTTDESFYEGVHKLEGGTTLLGSSGDLRTKRYWNPAAIETSTLSDDQLVERLRTLLRRSIADRVGSDSSVLMSGGLDSTTVAAVAQRLNDDRGRPPTTTYSVVFDEVESLDERTGVEVMQEAYGLDSTVVTGNDACPLNDETLCELVFTEHPCLDSGLFVNRLAFERLEADGVDAVLTGIGGNLHDGDRLCYADFFRSFRLRRLWRAIRSDEVTYTTGIGLYGLGPALTSGFTFIHELNDQCVGPPWPEYLSPEAAAQTNLDDRLRPRHEGLEFDSLERTALYYSLTDPYIDFALEGVRRVGLQYGIERRHPFLDARIVEFLFSLPTGTRFRDGRRKHLFRRAFEEFLPRQLRGTCTSKNVYDPLIHRSLRRRERDLLVDAFDDPALVRRGLVRPDALDSLVERYLSGGDVSASLVWRLLTCELWLESLSEG